MHRANTRMIGLTLLTGAALAAGCGGDDGGGGGGNGGNPTSGTSGTSGTTGTSNVNTTTSSQSATGTGTTGGTATGTGTTTAGTTTAGTTTAGTGTTTAGTTTAGATTAGTTTAGTGTTGTATAGTATGTTGTGTSTTGTATAGTATGTTGTGTSTTGSGGAGCDDDPPVGSTTGGAGEGGAAGASDGLEEGWNFVDESEVGEWSIVECADDATDCVDDADASIDFSCGVMQVEIEWPEAANTAAAKFQVQNVVSETMLRDLTGKVLYARVRMTSEAAADHGYDFDVIAQDYIVDGSDSNDWKWFSTCYNGSGNCPDNPSGETYTTDTWVPLTLPMSADIAPADFAFDGIRKFAIQIATKYWAAGEPFAYDSAPTTFEIDYLAW